jgi:hypothetical protein
MEGNCIGSQSPQRTVVPEKKKKKKLKVGFNLVPDLSVQFSNVCSSGLV